MERREEVRTRLLGLIDEKRIRMFDIPRPDAAIRDRYLALGDLSSTVSDVLDEKGVGAALSSDRLRPAQTGQRICGPAITIRYVAEGGSVGSPTLRTRKARLADRDLYAVGLPGDVAVFDCGGDTRASVMGGLSARWAVRSGLAGCIVDGAIRDIDSIRDVGLNVWSRGRTPVTGKYRYQAVEINSTVAIGGACVNPGDLIVGDSTGICVVPHGEIEAVLEACEEEERAESELIALIDRGAPVSEIVSVLAPEKW